jgi:hypothetical protein
MDWWIKYWKSISVVFGDSVLPISYGFYVSWLNLQANRWKLGRFSCLDLHWIVRRVLFELSDKLYSTLCVFDLLYFE